MTWRTLSACRIDTRVDAWSGAACRYGNKRREESQRGTLGAYALVMVHRNIRKLRPSEPQRHPTHRASRLRDHHPSSLPLYTRHARVLVQVLRGLRPPTQDHLSRPNLRSARIVCSDVGCHRLIRRIQESHRRNAVAVVESKGLTRARLRSKRNSPMT